MSSLLTNVSALTALQTLNASSQSLETTQRRISTGLRVATAADNAAYWSIATTMRSDNASLSAVKDALALGSATIDVAASALDSTIGVVNNIKAKLVAGKQPGVDRAKIQDEISALQKQLKSIADSAVFSGQNWLSVDSSAPGYNATKSIVSSFSRDIVGAVVVSTIDVDTSATKLYDTNGQLGLIDKSRTANATTIDLASMDISALTDNSADQQTLSDYITIADAVLNDTTSAASTLGAFKTRVTTQATFVATLMDSVTKGIGSLVDADMNSESTRLQSLQVQQQLGVQSLTIANQNSQMILKLFSY